MKKSLSADKDAMGIRALLSAAADSRIAIPAMKVSIVVGIVLNLINLGGRVADGGGINWLQVILNFVVPYCVASYSAARNELRKRR